MHDTNQKKPVQGDDYSSHSHGWRAPRRQTSAISAAWVLKDLPKWKNPARMIDMVIAAEGQREMRDIHYWTEEKIPGVAWGPPPNIFKGWMTRNRTPVATPPNATLRPGHAKLLGSAGRRKKGRLLQTQAGKPTA